MQIENQLVALRLVVDDNNLVQRGKENVRVVNVRWMGYVLCNGIHGLER